MINDEVYVSNNKLSSTANKYNAKLAKTKRRTHIQKKLGEDTYGLVDKDSKSIASCR